jgi:hypothetical protein
LPDFEKIKNENPEIHHMLWNNGTIPCHFAYNNEKTKNISLKLMEEVDEMIKKKYFLTDQDLLSGYFNGDYLPTFKLAEQFSKNYKISLNLFRDWQGALNDQFDHKINLESIDDFMFYDKVKNHSFRNQSSELFKMLNIIQKKPNRNLKSLVKSIQNINDEEISLIEFLNFADKLIA